MTNRHERRRQQALGDSVKMEMITPERAKEMLAGGRLCAWQGCEKTYEGGAMPDGWRTLLMFWSRFPVSAIADIPSETWDRDGVLCPHHARELDGLLKSTGRELLAAKAGGNA
jgi:hypothetical protein